MESTKNSTNTCDIETGVCSPSETYLQDKNSIETGNIQQKPKLIYYYDALCGWCYGFSPVIAKLYNEYKDKIDFELISGGLFLGNRIGYINDIAPYIKAGAYKTVESTTGVKFGESFLRALFGDGEIVLNSLPPAIALCIVKETFPNRQLEFGEMLLKAIYSDGLSADDKDGFIKYAEKIGFDPKEFKAKMGDERYRNMAEREFELFKSSQVSGMPTLVLEHRGKQLTLSNGYNSLDNLRLNLKIILDK